MGLLAAREPIDRVIADKKTTPELRQRLVKVREARAFADVGLGRKPPPSPSLDVSVQ